VTAACPAPPRDAQSPLALSLAAFRADPIGLVAAAVLAGLALMAVFAPLLAPHDPGDTDLFRRFQPPVWMAGGEWAHPLGCDGLGRDMLSRLIHGARVSIMVGALVIGLAAVLGTSLGLLAGYMRGWVDALISRIVDTLLGFPYLVFAIGLMAMMGPGLHNIVFALVYKEWVFTCRVARAEALAAREQEYVEAALALGCGSGWILFREILPNVLSPVMVVATVRMATVIILEASLSFLGLGVQPPTASWGSMVADGRGQLFNAWWISTLPGLAILLLVMAINLFSQSLRDAFDPRLRA
jgi:ABC-type dipeptide/oligopeptide/nickel transport system permease subunit